MWFGWDPFCSTENVPNYLFLISECCSSVINNKRIVVRFKDFHLTVSTHLFALRTTTIPHKVELADITDTEMQTGMKGMKKGRAPGIDEMRVEMVRAAGESGISWTKRLLNEAR